TNASPEAVDHASEICGGRQRTRGESEIQERCHGSRPDETERAPREHDGECEARGPGDEPVPERLQSQSQYLPLRESAFVICGEILGRKAERAAELRNKARRRGR